MQHQQVYTGQINKSLKEVMGDNLHKGVVEVHEKNIGLPHKNQTVTPSKKKVIL